MTMPMQRADGSWLGLLFIVGAIAFQLVKAMSRGNVEPLPPASTPSDPTPAYRPHPASAPAPTAARSELPPRLRDLFETLSVPGGFPPGVPRPGSGPTAPDSFFRPEPTPSPVESASSEIMAVPSLSVPTLEAFPSMPIRSGPRLDLLRLNNRQDWERAILLSEILQPPLALRSQDRS